MVSGTGQFSSTKTFCMNTSVYQKCYMWSQPVWYQVPVAAEACYDCVCWYQVFVVEDAVCDHCMWDTKWLQVLCDHSLLDTKYLWLPVLCVTTACVIQSGCRCCVWSLHVWYQVFVDAGAVCDSKCLWLQVLCVISACVITHVCVTTGCRCCVWSLPQSVWSLVISRMLPLLLSLSPSSSVVSCQWDSSSCQRSAAFCLWLDQICFSLLSLFWV